MKKIFALIVFCIFIFAMLFIAVKSATGHQYKYRTVTNNGIYLYDSSTTVNGVYGFKNTNNTFTIIK